MTNSTANPRLNPNSSEYDPSLAHHEQETALSPEEIAGYNASLYGFTETSTRTVESYGNEGVASSEINRLRGDVPDADIWEAAVDADHVAYNARVFENDANDMLTKVGLGEVATASNVTDAAATEVALAEQLEVGTEPSSDETLRAEHALVAATFARTIEKGDLTPFESLKDVDVANDISYRLHDLRQRYGSASYAPLEQLAVVGALIDHAQKVSPDTDETIIEADSNGQVTVQSIEELSVQAESGNGDAIKQLIDSDNTAEIIDATQEAKLIAGYGSLENVPPEVWQELTAKQGLRKDGVDLAA